MGSSWKAAHTLLCKTINVSQLCGEFDRFINTQRQWPLKDPKSVSIADKEARDGASYKQLIHLGQII